jgi:hypothetical protein
MNRNSPGDRFHEADRQGLISEQAAENSALTLASVI